MVVSDRVERPPFQAPVAAQAPIPETDIHYRRSYSQPPTRAQFRQLLADTPPSFVPRRTDDHRSIQLTCQDLSGWRSRMRLSQADLARELDVTVRTIQRWEHGDRGLPPFMHLVLRSIELELT